MPKTVKRQRVKSSITVPLQATHPKHEAFTDWSKAQGVEINAVRPQSLSGKGLGLVTTRKIKEDERILFVPEQAMFKPNFSILRQKKLERLSSQAKLAFSSLLGFSEKNLNPWLDTWPTVSDFESCMPLYWDSTVVNTLPISAIKIYERQLADYEKDFQASKVAVHESGHTEAEFKYHWMIVNSRSFYWSPARGGAGYMVMCPFIDYLNHGTTGTGCNVFQRSDGYEVVAQRNYEAGEELSFSYGAHPNEKLLVHYGFMLPYSETTPPHDDDVRLDEYVSPLLLPEITQQLADVGYAGPYTLVPKKTHDGLIIGMEPCFKTQVAVRATLLTCNEWEFFAGNGEDLGDDKSLLVDDVLVKALEALLLRIERKQTFKLTCPSSMKKEHFDAAQQMIETRWEQIQSAVKWYTAQQKDNKKIRTGT